MIFAFSAYLKGYVKIHAKGYFLERFLNLCINNDIFLWDLNRLSESELYAKINISAFKELKKYTRKTRTKIRIKQKVGLPFFINRHKSRRGVLIGFFLFILILYYFSTHLMGISIESPSPINQTEIVSTLNSFGVKMGTPLKEIDQKTLKNQLMTALDDYGFIGVNLKGSRLYLSLRERKLRKDALDSTEPCNIVASKSGVIRLMEIKDGQTMVLIDTLVEKGDLLVSGVIDSSVQGMRYTHSYGEVWATTWYEEEISIPLSYKEKIMTGKTKAKRTLNILNFDIKLYFKDKPDFKLYKEHKSEKEYSLPLKIFPSLFIKKQEFFEQTEKNTTRTEREALTLGKFILLNQVNNKLADGGKIEEVQLTHKKIGNNIIIKLKCQCYENIATQTPIDKIDDLEYNSNID